MLGHQGGGGGGGNNNKKGDKVALSPGLQADLNALAKAEQYERHCRVGLNALPIFDDETIELEHFGLPVQLKQIGIYEVPVLPWGWHTDVGEC